jgi:hypothetical protein
MIVAIITPLWAEWFFSPSCFGYGLNGSGARISGAVGTVQRRQDKSRSPFWSICCGRSAGYGVPPEGGGAAFPENPIESVQIAPPIAVLGIWRGEGGTAREKLGHQALVCGWDN